MTVLVYSLHPSRTTNININVHETSNLKGTKDQYNSIPHIKIKKRKRKKRRRTKTKKSPIKP